MSRPNLISGLAKEAACNVRDLASIPGSGRSAGEGKGYSLLYSDLENSMDCITRGVAKSGRRLSDFHSLCREKRSGDRASVGGGQGSEEGPGQDSEGSSQEGGGARGRDGGGGGS